MNWENVPLMKSKDVNDLCMVSGGAGFIGSSLTENLLNDGHKVTVVDNFSSGTRKNLQNVLDQPASNDR